MNDTRWTPGPWRLGTPGPNQFPTVGTVGGLMVAMVTHGVDHPALENANLIAAAPDLYAALEDMLWPIMAGCQKPTIERCMCAKCVEDRSRAALAKARGAA